jgi:ribosomal protein S18 acetylase RimI-like enzyme
MTEVVFRPGAVADAVQLAAFMDMASQGLATRLWLGTAVPGQGPFEIGRARAMRDDVGWSYRNATFAEVDGAVAGVVVDYPMKSAGRSPTDIPDLLVPLLELEALVPDSWYVNVLGVYPEFRGRGIGARLLKIADQRAAASNPPGGLSIIVASTNEAARRLYDRHGFRFAAKRPVVTFPGGPGPGDWLLLTKPPA